MGLAKLERIYQEILKTSHKITQVNIKEQDINYSEIVIPFSKLFKSYKKTDIYSGNEKIPFNERIHEFKKILRQEFSTI